MNEWRTAFDFVSPMTSLYFEGKCRYHTNFGFFMSIINNILIIVFTVIFFLSFLNGDEITFMYSKDSKNNYVSGNLSNKVFYYSIKDGNGKVVDPRFLDIVARYSIIDNQGEVNEPLTETDCPFNQERKDFINYDITGYKCLNRKNNENITLFSSKLPDRKAYINIFLKKCTDKASTGEECFPEDEINSRLKSESFYFHFITESLTIDNYNNPPIITSVYSEHIPLSEDLIYIYQFQMKKVKYNDDRGIILGDTKVYEDFGIDTDNTIFTVLQKNIQLEVENSLLNFQLSINKNYIENYKRSHQKIQMLFSKIGGISSFFYFITHAITVVLSKGMIIVKISEATFNKNGKTPSALLRVKQNYGVPINNYVDMKNSFGSLVQSQLTVDISFKRKKNLNCCRLMFFRCIGRKNFRNYLKLCEKSIIRLLDVKNIIVVNKKIEDSKEFFPTPAKTFKKETNIITFGDKKDKKTPLDNTSDEPRERKKMFTSKV